MVEKHCGNLILSDDEINVGVTRKNGEEPPPLPSEEPHLALNCAKLHALLWANPLLHAARELGISDVSLKRHCRKLRCSSASRVPADAAEPAPEIPRAGKPQPSCDSPGRSRNAQGNGGLTDRKDQTDE